jgi:hypothetical protein
MWFHYRQYTQRYTQNFVSMVDGFFAMSRYVFMPVCIAYAIDRELRKARENCAVHDVQHVPSTENSRLLYCVFVDVISRTGHAVRRGVKMFWWLSLVNYTTYTCMYTVDTHVFTRSYTQTHVYAGITLSKCQILLQIRPSSAEMA